MCSCYVLRTSWDDVHQICTPWKFYEITHKARDLFIPSGTGRQADRRSYLALPLFLFRYPASALLLRRLTVLLRLLPPLLLGSLPLFLLSGKLLLRLFRLLSFVGLCGATKEWQRHTRVWGVSEEYAFALPGSNIYIYMCVNDCCCYRLFRDFFISKTRKICYVSARSYVKISYIQAASEPKWFRLTCRWGPSEGCYQNDDIACFLDKVLKQKEKHTKHTKTTKLLYVPHNNGKAFVNKPDLINQGG